MNSCVSPDPLVEVGVAPLLEDGVVALLPLELADVRLVAPRAVLEVRVRYARQPKRRAGNDILRNFRIFHLGQYMYFLSRHMSRKGIVQF